jgi:ribosomal protein L11 methyltransferase
MSGRTFGICITVQDEGGEDLPWELHDLGAAGVETRDATTMTGVTAADTVVYIAGFDDESRRNQAAEVLGRKYPGLELSRLEITDDGWSEGWKKFFRPVVLEKVQVITPWMEAPEERDVTIVIDPGQAFGTGGHATTRLMLQFIEKLSDPGFPETILDVGTGSGVLAIACARLGASAVVGFDVEEPAVDAARENAQRNHVGDAVSVMVASPEQVKGQWPMVLANIQLAVFLEHADSIANLVSPGGTLLISGILTEQRERCLALWPQFLLRDVMQEEEWLAMHLEKNL